MGIIEWEQTELCIDSVALTSTSGSAKTEKQGQGAVLARWELHGSQYDQIDVCCYDFV